MTFTPDQIAALDAPLMASAVKQRQQSGRNLSYIEGWHAIAEANRIFGFDGWTREAVETRLVAERERKIGPATDRDGNPKPQKDGWGVSYVVRVKIVAGTVIREGIGSGHGIDVDLGLAHESAIKEAETDAMKRALMTFGNPFGLALYDKTQENVERAPPPTTVRVAPAVNFAPNGADRALSEQLGKLIRDSKNLEDLEGIKADPDFKTKFKALPLALQATVGEVIKTMRAQFERAA